MRPLKRLVALVLTAGVGAGAITAVAVAPAIAGSTSSTPTIKLISTNKGKLLSVKGFVVYRFSRDGNGNKNTCLKVKNCSKTWPALTTVGKPQAGPGVKASLLGTTKLPNGKHQVTYARPSHLQLRVQLRQGLDLVHRCPHVWRAVGRRDRERQGRQVERFVRCPEVGVHSRA